ncbi:fumarylacetoacetate hydrolase family protein [Microlunatus parietis]|uniref:2-keto-4-pentenoate hydratase/2-oxohepta-3-ene-1,7-dioic acid hydratase in catechol pathway/regulator of RNase E activity RraA n=1 Tax=Microlunatus parietis TaxID=682979 RepID=A0A7Y9ICQ8_9ACTN|nr:fumarylacetoacetate hydrolase family protein [Microlunatus parietis]NYE74427.1 2-keto-4-pentenoate hydratase/2-oxohepta-3-ene-1,7-dioic acid hydratase in catechol pathway/regulator of RNase E activity RraA [Microlunatus parietis]
MISEAMTPLPFRALPYDDGGAGLPYPSKIIAVHLNFESRAAERGRRPEQPSYFLKPVSSLASSGGVVERPAGTELLGFEGEIALVIKETTRRATPEQAWSRVAGVTAANDLGVYDLRYADKGSNLRSKGGDGFTPIGPALIPADRIDPGRLRLRTWVNGEPVQEDDTGALIFDFARLVADLSQLITLEAGDLILTGTPAGASVIMPGDRVEVEVDAPSGPTTGRLLTTVSAGEVPLAGYGAGPKVDDATRADAWGNGAGRAQALRQAQGAPGNEAQGAEGPLTEEVRAALGRVGTATLSSQLRKRGLDNVSIDGVVALRSGERLLGIARTLRMVPLREDLFKSHGGGYNAQKRAVDTLNPGDVLVIEARGEPGTGTIGDILALRAKVRGAAGVVTDGGVRDHDAVAELGLPVYCAGAHPAVLGRRHVPWDVDQTIACGGTTVQPGDVIIGDADGVLVIPPGLVAEVAADAVEQERQETFIAEQVAAGEPVDGLYPMNEAWREKYRQWRP